MRTRETLCARERVNQWFYFQFISKKDRWEYLLFMWTVGSLQSLQILWTENRSAALPAQTAGRAKFFRLVMGRYNIQQRYISVRSSSLWKHTTGSWRALVRLHEHTFWLQNMNNSGGKGVSASSWYCHCVQASSTPSERTFSNGFLLKKLTYI